jgi:superfamily II RNA helicase
MREVAWVIFDEIHYMRDLGKSTITPYLYVKAP